MTTEQLRELRDLAARATSGPYSADQIAALTRPPLREADAAFVAAVSPERIIALVDEVIRARRTGVRDDRDPLCYPCFAELNESEGKPRCADRDDSYNACCNQCGMELGA